MNQVEVKRHQIEIGSGLIGLINILIFGKILGDNGIAYLVIALEAFWFIRTISSACLTDALGKMLRMRVTKGQYKNALSIRKKVLILEGIIGIVCSIIFLFLAEIFAQNVFKVQHSTFIMMVLAPALFLQTISSVLIGFFQGEGNELPAVVAAPLRQLVLMGFGLLFANMLGEYGTKVSNLLGDASFAAMYSGVGIAIAIDLAELLVFVFLGLITLGNRNSLLKRGTEGMKQTDSLLNTVKVLYGSMWMAMLLRLFEMLPIWLGTLFYRKRVADMSVFTQTFGLFVGKYIVACGIPVLLIYAMSVSVIAKTVSAYKKEDQRSAKIIFQSGVHNALVHGLFFTVFAAVMAEHLAGVFSENNMTLLTELLRYGSGVILFIALFFYFSRLLLRMGRKYHLLGCLGIANIPFIIILSVLLNGGKSAILSMVYAAMVALGISIFLLGFMCCRMLRAGIDWLQIIAIPVGAVCVAGLVCMFLGNLLTPHLGYLVTAFVCLVISFIIYWVILLIFRSFREQELKYIPGSKIIRAAGQTLRVFDMD